VFRVATLNLLHGRSLSDGLVDLDRVAEGCASLGADVIGLQEVDRDQPRSGSSDLTSVVADAIDAVDSRFQPALVGTPGATWRVANDDEPVGDPHYGVGLVSRHPVTEWHVVPLTPARIKAPVRVPGSKQTIWIEDEPRIGLAARVRAPFGEVTVATTHLSFVPGWNVLQLRRLVSGLRRALPPPYLLLGDLNLIGGVPRVATGWRSLVAAKTYPAPKPSVQLDHVLASGTLPEVVDARAVALTFSDHRALTVDFRTAA
jgi:endonuclease/exonuclease/phosphatase family metal-dependent hydrolase